MKRKRRAAAVVSCTVLRSLEEYEEHQTVGDDKG